MELTIKNQPLERAEKIKIDHIGWGMDEYVPETYAQIVYDETGFTIKFTVKESNPQTDRKKHFEAVCKDSCVEFFVKFDPDHSEHYFNFEINPIGTINVGFRTSRFDAVYPSLEEIEALHIETEILEDYWMVKYHIGLELLQKYYPGFTMGNCKYLKVNIYQCGNENMPPHYTSLFPIDTPSPDFHRPEYFGVIKLV